ncbi:MAG TPA: hypothetical protein VFT46_03055 [Holophagaceae bacterium]|nr:hypothetical protein [Holophagaceae bacterium]
MPSDPRPWPQRYRWEDGVVCIDLRLRAERQLFDARDPAPFRERDLDADAVAWILQSMEEVPKRAPAKIVIQLRERSPQDLEPEALREAVRAHFRWEIERLRRQRRADRREGAFFLLLAVPLLALCLGLAVAAKRIPEPGLAAFLGEGLPIVGWVAMWRPLELFLYDGWPLRRRIRLCERVLGSEIEV